MNFAFLILHYKNLKETIECINTIFKKLGLQKHSFARSMFVILFSGMTEKKKVGILVE